MKIKKPKAFKKKVFRKDCDEQFVVVFKPYREGRTGPWDIKDTAIVAEWLRRAAGWRTQCVHAVYTLNSVRTARKNS